jgi:hypothetical protein
MIFFKIDLLSQIMPVLNNIVVVENLSKDDIKQSAFLIGDVFSKYEPQSVHWKLNENDLTLWSNDMLLRSLQDNLSMCIKCDEQVIGCIICSKMTRKINQFPLPKAQEIFKMTSNIISNFDNKQERIYYNKDETVYIHIAAINPLYSKKGLCTTLLTHCIEKAKKKGYKWMMSELTSPGTQHIMINKLNFKPVIDVNYNDYGNGFKNCKGKTVLAILEI